MRTLFLAILLLMTFPFSSNAQECGEGCGTIYFEPQAMNFINYDQRIDCGGLGVQDNSCPADNIRLSNVIDCECDAVPIDEIMTANPSNFSFRVTVTGNYLGGFTSIQEWDNLRAIYDNGSPSNSGCGIGVCVPNGGSSLEDRMVTILFEVIEACRNCSSTTELTREIWSGTYTRNITQGLYLFYAGDDGVGVCIYSDGRVSCDEAATDCE